MPRHSNGAGGEAEGTLPRGPSREEQLLLEMYDIVESRVRRLPAGLEWQQITVRRTDHGLRVFVTV